MDVLDVNSLVKTYGGRKVVDGVSFRVGPGEIVGLLGPNGAGKSTSFRMTCGMVTPDGGKVILGGQDVTDWPMYRRARDGHMGYLAQEASVFRKLTVEQNISSMLELLGVDRKTRRRRTQELLEQFDIVKIRRSKAAKLSGGERRRLEIARCLITNPQIIMLDEPYAGIDPVTVQSIRGTINRLRDTGIAILITDHAAMEILRTVDRCYVINEGKVLFEGTPDEVKMHKQVQKQYLGDIEGEIPNSSPAASRESPVKAPHWLKRPAANTAAPAAPPANKTTLRRRTDV